MAELKTKKSRASVIGFLKAVENEQRRNDGLQLLKIFKQVTGKPAKMWGNSIVGFGEYHYKSERSRQEGDWPLTGFSPRKAAHSIYIMPGYADFGDILSRLGKHKLGKSCLYVNKLADIDLDVLAELIAAGLDDLRRHWPVEPI